MRLGFYVNPLVKLRKRNGLGEPEPAVFASLAMSAGAQVVLVGWSKSGGLITERDIKVIRDVIHGDFIAVIPCDEASIDFTVKLRPAGVILVSGGWNGKDDIQPVQMEVDASNVSTIAHSYKAASVSASIFIDPIPSSVKAAAKAGLAGVVIDAAAYADALTDSEAEKELCRIEDAVLAAQKFSLIPAIINHLDYRNLAPIARIRFIEDVYCGQAIISRALMKGIDQAVTEMISLIERSCN